DPPVLAEVGNGLHAAARQVEIGHRAAVEDREGVEPLRRAVEVPVAGERRGGDEEDVLGAEKRLQLLVDLVVGLAHAPPPDAESTTRPRVAPAAGSALDYRGARAAKPARGRTRHE